MGRIPSRESFELNQGTLNELTHDEAQPIEMAASTDSPELIEASVPFVGRWELLISTTNWEKGRIILQWRAALMERGASPTAYSDEAWARHVGNITSQHVGRLRRTSERFADTHASYPNLYWTHFLAALDWDDAEMWLEGASQSRWSVAQMRRTRWETLGSDPTATPQDAEVVPTELDDGFVPLAEDATTSDREPLDRAAASGSYFEGPDFGDADQTPEEQNATDDGPPFEPNVAPAEIDHMSIFAGLPTLPVDVLEALEQFKLVIVRHRMSDWSEISQPDLLKVLDALYRFANIRAQA